MLNETVKQQLALGLHQDVGSLGLLYSCIAFCLPQHFFYSPVPRHSLNTQHATCQERALSIWVIAALPYISPLADSRFSVTTCPLLGKKHTDLTCNFLSCIFLILRSLRDIVHMNECCKWNKNQGDGYRGCQSSGLFFFFLLLQQ